MFKHARGRIQAPRVQVDLVAQFSVVHVGHPRAEKGQIHIPISTKIWCSFKSSIDSERSVSLRYTRKWRFCLHSPGEHFAEEGQIGLQLRWQVSSVDERFEIRDAVRRLFAPLNADSI